MKRSIQQAGKHFIEKNIPTVNENAAVDGRKLA